MAEEANVTLTDLNTSGAEMELPQQDSGANAADKAVDEGTSDAPKEGADEEEVANGNPNLSQSYQEPRLTTSFLQSLRLTVI